MSTFGPNDQRPSWRAQFVRAPASGMAVLPPPADFSRGEHERRPRAVPDLRPEPTDDREWDQRTAREVRHQEVIEASFDRAEAYGRVGDFEHALEWLDRATALSGSLPTGYRAQRARWARAAALRPRPVGRDWPGRHASSSDGAGGR
jgi:hypothetical protein